jgi:hypothetical protein
MNRRIILFVCFTLEFFTHLNAQTLVNKQEASNLLAAYRCKLDTFRNEFGGGFDLPDIKFFLFGMGNRTKFVYRDGMLMNASSGEIIKSWSVKDDMILPASYMVWMADSIGEITIISENETGVWVETSTGKELIPGTNGKISLPDFRDNEYAQILRVLHHEILINIVDSKPLPNYLVYSNPWRRDAAMMAFCLEKTGNLTLIKDWILSIDSPYDRNNAGETEADNLGQTLYLLSLFSDSNHPVVGQILEEVKKFEIHEKNGIHIRGRSDFHETPVYQTKWLKYGLSKLGLPDIYSVPFLDDDYATLFWWDYKESYFMGTNDAHDKWKTNNYPYIGWAADHFHGLKRGPISNRDYPLTWEIEASQADYSGMEIIDSVYVHRKISVPHTWHTAEVFLYLTDNQ